MSPLKNKVTFFNFWYHPVFVGLGLIVILLFIFLPSFLPWSLFLNPRPKNIFQELLSYQHPLQATVTSSVRPEIATPYILIDANTNQILTSKDPSVRIYPASITKLATAVTALNLYPLDEVVSVGSTYSEGKIMELKTGEQISIKNLVTALLVYSANDSAYTLADHHPQGISGFVKEMNLLLQKYHLTNTNFTNFDGIHSPDHYSTVYDLAELGRIAIKNPIIRNTVKEKEITVTSTDGKIIHQLVSTNELLGKYPEVEGLKTGYTIEAGGCFVSLINLNGHYLIGVVAQSEDRFADTIKLLNWAKSNISWQPYQL